MEKALQPRGGLLRIGRRVGVGIVGNPGQVQETLIAVILTRIGAGVAQQTLRRPVHIARFAENDRILPGPRLHRTAQDRQRLGMHRQVGRLQIEILDDRPPIHGGQVRRMADIGVDQVGHDRVPPGVRLVRPVQQDRRQHEFEVVPAGRSQKAMKRRGDIMLLLFPDVP